MYRFVFNALLLIVPATFVPQLSFADDAPPPPATLESYLCSYLPGKDQDDLMKAKDNLVKARNMADIPLRDTYLWNHYKGDSQVDVIWHSVYPGLGAWASDSDASAASSAVTAAVARFDTIVDCTPMMGAIRPLHMQEEQGSGSFVGASACRTKHGVTNDGLEDLFRHMSGVLGSMGDTAPDMVIAVRPFNSGPNVPDVVIFNVNDSATAWSKFVATLNAGNGMLRRHFNTTLDCSVNMWGSQQIIEGSGG